MATSFSISGSRCSALSPGDLQEEIQSHTGNESETDSILRSMDRFGRDETIRYYEVIPQARPRTRRTGPTTAWTVRAVR